MRAITLFLTGIVLLVFLLAIFPLFRETAATLNTTANITEYEGMWQAVQFAPVFILFSIGLLVLAFMFKDQLKKMLPFGRRDDDA